MSEQKNKVKLTSLEKHWILYDVGNSAFTLMVATLIPIFYNGISSKSGLSSADYFANWSLTQTIATIIVAILGPIMGAFADKKGRKKPVFLATITIGAIFAALIGFASGNFAFLLIFLIAKCSYSLSLVIYDSTLGDVTSDERADNVSAQGFAWGYIGSVVPFVICLLLYYFAGKDDESRLAASAPCMILVAVWWFAMSVPILKNYKQNNYISDEEAKDMLFTRLGKSLKEMVKDKKIFLFVIAFFFYIDGVYTIIGSATSYGKALGFDSMSLLLALLATQFVAFPSTLMMGYLSKKIKPETMIIVCIFAYMAITVFAYLMSRPFHFWILAVAVGLFQGGIQSLSRSYFAKIIPSEKSGQYFGFLDICGKGADALGSFVMWFMTKLTNNPRAGIGFVVVFFIIGFALFRASAKICRDENE